MARMHTPGTVADDDWKPAPLRSEQIIDGERPTTRTRDFGASPDGNFSYNLWDCTAGKFRWTYGSDEVIHVLEGSATITPVGGEPRTVKAGDVVYFEKGLVAVWHVERYIKKLAVHRSHTSLRDTVTTRIKKLTRF